MTKRNLMSEHDELQQLNKANISNLTQLWKLMGSQPLVSDKGGNWQTSTGWPNRCWIDWGEIDESALLIEENLSQLKKQMIIPLWKESGEVFTGLKQMLIHGGFEVSFEQTAMYLDLKNYQLVQSSKSELSKRELSKNDLKQKDKGLLQVKEINSEKDIETWTNIASRSFGYQIDSSSIHHAAASSKVKLLLAFVDEQPAATAMLFDTGGIIGVHQVGVLPDFRGKGIARKLMKQVMELCVGLNGQYVTLQASVEGNGLYDSLGFREQFVIFNYVSGGAAKIRAQT